MELKYFRLIKTIVEEGSLANSSEKLFLTQSALSHQLSVLEKQLGFKVFHRSRNKWQLTEEGEELYKLANEIFQSIDQGFKKIHYIKEGSKGTIQISTECSTFYQGFPAFMQKMGYLYPDIDIQLNEPSSQSFTKLLAKEIDMAIVTSKAPSKDLLSLKFYEDEIEALMSKEHPLAEKVFLEASDFLGQHLIIQSFPLSTVSVYQHFLKPNQTNPKRISAGIHTEICLEMIQANMGMMCLAKWVLNPFKIPSDLVYKRIGVNGLQRKHYLVLRKEDRDKKYMDDFVNSFVEEFSSKEVH